MRMNEFLDKTCAQIEWKEASQPIREELQSHIQERMEEYMAHGETEENAEEKAVGQMGCPGQIGQELNKLHRKRLDWPLIAAIALIFLLGSVDTLITWKETASLAMQKATAIGFISSFVITSAIISLLAMGDVRKVFAHNKKNVIIFCICLCAIPPIAVMSKYQLHITNYFYRSWIDNLADQLLSLCIVGMIVCVGAWLTRMRSMKSLLWFLPAVAAGIGMLLIPSKLMSNLLYVVPFAACTVILCAAARMRNRAVVILAASGLILLVCSGYLLLTEKHLEIRMLREISNLELSLGQNSGIRAVVSGLRWFSPADFDMSLSAFNSSANPNIRSGLSWIHIDNAEYALLRIMIYYGIAAGVALIGICGLAMWRILVLLNRVHDKLGRTLAFGLSWFIIGQSIWNVLVNFGLAPKLINFYSTFIPMFQTPLSQNMVAVCTIGLLIGLYRKKDLYS